MSWRVTFSKQDRSTMAGINAQSFTLDQNQVLKVSDRTELRSADGTIVRLGKGAEIEIKDSPIGVRPYYYGPIFIAKKGGCGKYRTSCWLKEANPLSERPDIFMCPGKKPDTDEFFALSGDIVIYEIDEENRTFTICIVNEGEKAIVQYNGKARKIRNRYKAKVQAFSDSEYGKILKDYIDRRNWV